MDSSAPDDRSRRDEGSGGDGGAAAVVFFSCTGRTRSVAEGLAACLGADLIEIVPAVPYTSDDLRYQGDCRANREQDDSDARPEIAETVDVFGYDTVLLGYPIWWGRAPRIILTLLESVNLSGRVIRPFCTSGLSGIEGSLGELERLAPDARWEEGKRYEPGQVDV